MTFTTRKINLSFSLGEGSFGESGADTVDVDGLRTSCQISRAGGVSLSQMSLRVWGLPLDTMRKLTVLNALAFEQQRMNTVTVTAGDDDRGFGVVFSGVIKEAWVDASNAPDIVFVVSAFESLFDKVRPVVPSSYKGPVAVDTILSSLARQMNPPRAFENSGVDVVLDNPYLPGTIVDQIQEVARQAKCQISIDERTVAIWPIGQARGAASISLSPETGLVGYPQFTQTGVVLTTLFSPSVVFGQQVQVQSALEAANGTWVVANVVHNLDAEIPGGQWFTVLECGLLGYAAPIIG